MKAGLRRYVNGDYEKDELLKKYVPVAMGVLYGLLLLALAFYPHDGPEGPYSIFKNSISSLGDWSYNDRSWFFFSVAMVWIGVAIWPVVPYVYKRLSPICLHTTRFGAFFGVLVPFGMVLTGIFAENDVLIPGTDLEYGDVHGPVAVLGFGGIGLALLIWGLPVLKDHFWGHKLVPLKKLLPGTVYFAFVVAATAGTQVYVESIDAPSCGGFSGCDPAPFLSWGFWEWNLLWAVTAYLFLFLWCLPADPKLVRAVVGLASRVEGEGEVGGSGAFSPEGIEREETSKSEAKVPAAGAAPAAAENATAPTKEGRLRLLLQLEGEVDVEEMADLMDVKVKFLLPLLERWAVQFGLRTSGGKVLVEEGYREELLSAVESQLEDWKLHGRPGEWRI
ncbi:MAG: hypothetical protein Kow0069_39150 [Promethearchaeota archaeon]